MNFYTKIRLSSKLQKKIPFFGNYYNLIVLIAFLALSIILILRHEFWRDEILAWHLSSESHSVSQFIGWLTHSYGHPFLWNLILYIISHFITENIEAMKVVHLTISAAIVFLFLKYSLFNKFIKILFVFSYFIFYEYSIISRNYSLGVLFIILFCILYKEKYKNLILLGIVLFFMGQATLYSFVISLVFAFLLILDILRDRKKIKKELNKFILLGFFLIVIFGIILIYLQFKDEIFKGNVFTPEKSQLLSNFLTNYKKSLKIATNGYVSSFLPISEIRIDFWNTNLITKLLSNFNYCYIFLISIILFFTSILILKRRIITFYILGTIGILTIPFFLYGKPLIRYFGYFFIIFISSLWLSDLENNNDKFLFNISSKSIKTISNIFLIIILIISVIGTSIASYYDYKYPFSSGKQVAQYINDNYSNKNIKIIGYHDYATETIAGYLNKDIYYPELKEFSKFVNWEKHKNTLVMSLSDAFKNIDPIIKEGEFFLFIRNEKPIKKSELDELKNEYIKIREIKFENSIVSDENFYLYEFIKSKKILLLDFNNFYNCEFKNSKLSGDNKVLILNGGNNILKEIKVPINI